LALRGSARLHPWRAARPCAAPTGGRPSCPQAS
jgi:hypothetical protein